MLWSVGGGLANVKERADGLDGDGGQGTGLGRTGHGEGLGGEYGCFRGREGRLGGRLWCCPWRCVRKQCCVAGLTGGASRMDWWRMEGDWRIVAVHAVQDPGRGYGGNSMGLLNVVNMLCGR